MDKGKHVPILVRLIEATTYARLSDLVAPTPPKTKSLARGRFACGLRHETIQRCLLSEKDLTYAKALDIARSMEAADKNMMAFKPSESIHALSSQHSPARGKQSCYCCGRTNHNAEESKFKESER